MASNQDTRSNKADVEPGLRRNRVGSKMEDSYQYDDIKDINQLESAFSIQEYLQAVIRRNKDDVAAIISLPEGVDESIWIYEQLRQMCLDLNMMVIQLFNVCSRDSCPEMKAGEWLFLCAAHLPHSNLMSPQTSNGSGASPCCSIDYIVHTLNGATTLLNSNKCFPSRITVPPASQKHYPSLSRRLYRIFAHAYFHHKEVFDEVEANYSLYSRFSALCERFDLVSKDLRVIPSNTSIAETPVQISILSK